jgi:hypothetical protein
MVVEEARRVVGGVTLADPSVGEPIQRGGGTTLGTPGATDNHVAPRAMATRSSSCIRPFEATMLPA